MNIKPMTTLSVMIFAVISMNLTGSDSSENIENVKITKLRFYEKTNGKIHGLIILENNRMLTMNPDDPSHYCQLWTNSNAVYESARLAIKNQLFVDITYVPRGDELLSCQVDNISIIANIP